MSRLGTLPFIAVGLVALLCVAVLVAVGVVPAGAAPQPAVLVTWVGNLTPSGNSPQTIPSSGALPITVEVYAPGVTPGLGQGAGITCWLHYGQVSAFGGPWTTLPDIPMSYVGDVGNNDRYSTLLGPLPAGLYEYTAWCSGDGGSTKNWADIASTGGNGKLTVTPSGPTATPTPTSPSSGVLINFVGNLTPNGNTPQTITTGSFLPVSVQVFAPGVTPPAGQGPGIQCWLYFGTVSFFGGPWSNISQAPMIYGGDVGNNDLYAISWGPLPVGLYEFTAWCSGNGGATQVWSDNAATGGNGKLTVVAAPGPTPTVTPTPVVVPTGTPSPPNCQELLINGGFEYDAAWSIGWTARPATYVGAPNPVRSGLRSMQLGILAATPDADTFSSIQQVVTIPGDAQTANISFWYYPISADAPGGLDRQELILLDPVSTATEAVLWRVTENTQAWKSLQFDLTPFRGRTVAVYFNARNDGDNLRTAMYLDDVRLVACYSTWPPLVPTLLPIYPTVPAFPTPLPIFPTLPPIYPTLLPSIITPLPGEPVIPPGPPTTVAVESLVPPPTSPFAATATPTPTPTPARRGSPLSDIVNSLGPWALLCLMVIIIVVSIALIAQYLVQRRRTNQGQ